MYKNFTKKLETFNCFKCKLSFAFILISFFSTSLAEAQIYVTTGNSLQTQVNAAAPGAVFIIPNGTYNNFSATFTAIANATNPITVKAETVGGVTLTGSSKFIFDKAAHIILEGFKFDCTGTSTLVKLNGSNNIRVTRNEFKLVTTSSVKWVYIGGIWNDTTLPYQFLSHNNRIDHNIFRDKNTTGHYITVDGTNEVVQSQYDRIDHNYFYNNGPRATNEQESIRIGWSSMSMSSGFTIVEHNLFEDCDGDPEIVSVKSCDNIIRHNTFLRSYGTLSLRHGNRNRIEGNYFLGGNKPNGTSGTSTLYTGGIRIYGKDHLIINNYFEGLKGTQWDAPITLTQGDAIDGNSTNLTKHFRAENVTIAYNTLVNNTYGIEIGFDNNNNYNTTLKNINIANNIITGSENSLVNYIENQTQGSEIKWFNNIIYPTGTATLTSNGSTFTTAQVQQVNPNLTFDGTVYRATATSPLIANGIASLSVTEDIEGQSRPNSSNAGADHLSTDTALYAPMTTLTTGPYAYENGSGPSDVLFASTLSGFTGTGGTITSSITSNLSWTATSNDSWITVTPASGTDNGTISVTATSNPTCDPRSGTVTVVGGGISVTLTISQAAGDPTVSLNLINNGTASDPVTVTASTEQTGNTAIQTLDKDLITRWSGQGVGAYLVYDLGSTYNLDLIRIATLAGKIYLYEILTSIDGTNYTSVSNVQSNNLTSFSCYPVTNQARYVKIVGNGQTAGSDWNSITEIEFYGSSALTTENFQNNNLVVYPNPVQDILHIENTVNSFKNIKLYSIDGKLLLSKSFDSPINTYELTVSNFQKGTYLVKIEDVNNKSISKMIIISN